MVARRRGPGAMPRVTRASLYLSADWCRRRGSNPHGPFGPTVFKTVTSAGSTTSARDSVEDTRAWTAIRRARGIVARCDPTTGRPRHRSATAMSTVRFDLPHALVTLTVTDMGGVEVEVWPKRASPPTWCCRRMSPVTWPEPSGAWLMRPMDRGWTIRRRPGHGRDRRRGHRRRGHGYDAVQRLRPREPAPRPGPRRS